MEWVQGIKASKASKNKIKFKSIYRDTIYDNTKSSKHTCEKDGLYLVMAYVAGATREYKCNCTGVLIDEWQGSSNSVVSGGGASVVYSKLYQCKVGDTIDASVRGSNYGGGFLAIYRFI